MEFTYGKQIRAILKKRHMSIETMAELIERETGMKMSRQNLTQRLKRDNFQEQDMRLFADVLGCTVQLYVLENGERLPDEKVSVKEAIENDMTIGELLGNTKRKPVIRETIKSERDAAAEPDEEVFEEGRAEEAAAETTEDIGFEEAPAEEPVFDEVPAEEAVSEEALAEDAVSDEEPGGMEDVAGTAEEDDFDDVSLIGEEEEYETEFLLEDPESDDESDEESDDLDDMTYASLQEIRPSFDDSEDEIYDAERLTPEELEELEKDMGLWVEPLSLPEGLIQKNKETSPGREAVEMWAVPDNILAKATGEHEPEIDPSTGEEYESNVVRSHPHLVGYVQVYERSKHCWFDMTEWAFRGFQERKKMLLGADYTEPRQLD